MSLIGLISCAVFVSAGSIYYDKEAKRLGFLNGSERLEAEGVGVTDSKLWHENRDAILEKARAEKEAERANAKRREDPEEAEKRRENAATAAAAEKTCRANFNCWTNKFQRAATKACAPEVERLAINNFEWTDGFLSPKFPRAIYLNGSDMIMYVGDETLGRGLFIHTDANSTPEQAKRLTHVFLPGKGNSDSYRNPPMREGRKHSFCERE